MDGTTLRHACDRAPSTAALPLGRAWASANRWGLGQRKVEEKSHDLPALPRLLPLLDRKGAVVMLEAMGCQQESARSRTCWLRILFRDLSQSV
jgi:hypothetical protein